MTRTKSGLGVSTGVEDIRFAERSYRYAANYRGKDPESIPRRERTEGFQHDHGRGMCALSIDDLAWGLVPVFRQCGVTKEEDIRSFPFHNRGADYFKENYRPFDPEELQYLRERLVEHLK